MGAVADCCSTREIDQRKEGDENQPGILTPISQENGVNAKDEATFREHLWHKWRQHKVEISTFGGQTEGAILVEA